MQAVHNNRLQLTYPFTGLMLISSFINGGKMKLPFGTLASRKNNKLYWLLGFMLFYILSVITHLSYFPLNGDEPRRAIVSLEMLHSGNFIRPTTMGWEYYNKPPVYNWFIALCMKLTNSSSELAVRLPSLISLLVWGYCNYVIVKKILSPAIAALSSVFLVTSFDIYFWGLSNGGEIDVFYSLIVYLQVMSLFYYNLKRKWTALFVASYAFCAIGLLTKGFPSILFQGFTLLALCVFNKSPRLLFRWQHILGLAGFFAIAGGFFYTYSFHGNAGNYLADLLKESFNKSAFGENADKLVKKVIEYPGSFFKILLPWSLLLLLLFKKHRFRLWQNPVVRFCFLFIIFNIGPYWFTGHPRMRYAYMFLPFCMIILAYIFYQFKEEYPALITKIFKYLVLFFVVVLIAIITTAFFAAVNYVWLSIAALLLLFYILLYNKLRQYAVWYFAGGIVVLRFAYALVFIPVKYDKTKLRYDHEMAAIAAANNFQPVSIYKKPDQLDLIIDLKVTKLNLGTIPAIPYMAYQMPYYYYRSSGQLITYDTVLLANKNYIGFGSDLKGLAIDTLYSFKDYNQNDEEVMLFRKKADK